MHACWLKSWNVSLHVTALQAIGWIDSSFVQALRSVLHDAALVSEGDISEALKALSTKDDGLG